MRRPEDGNPFSAGREPALPSLPAAHGTLQESTECRKKKNMSRRTAHDTMDNAQQPGARQSLARPCECIRILLDMVRKTGDRRAIVISLVYGRVRARVPERRDAERAYASSTYAVSVNAILLAWTDALKRTVRAGVAPHSTLLHPPPLTQSVPQLLQCLLLSTTPTALPPGRLTPAPRWLGLPTPTPSFHRYPLTSNSTLTTKGPHRRRMKATSPLRRLRAHSRRGVAQPLGDAQ